MLSSVGHSPPRSSVSVANSASIEHEHEHEYVLGVDKVNCYGRDSLVHHRLLLFQSKRPLLR
jgi:hypothetical protein